MSTQQLSHLEMPLEKCNVSTNCKKLCELNPNLTHHILTMTHTLLLETTTNMLAMYY